MRLLSLSDLRARGITFSRQWLHKLVRENKFPKPVKVGNRTLAWVESEVDAWMAARVDQRDSCAA
jgi:prophage regulatory protein